MSKISTGYRQLASLFEALENARFKPDIDFGANVATCFCWYLSPAAVLFLEKINNPYWLAIKANQQFKCNFQKWDGYIEQGADIKLKL